MGIDNIAFSALFAELGVISCNDDATLLVVVCLCQVAARAEGQLVQGMEQDMPILFWGGGSGREISVSRDSEMLSVAW